MEGFGRWWEKINTCEECGDTRKREKKAYRGRMEKMMGEESYLRGMWEHFFPERSRAKRFREPAEKEKQAGIQGQWQLESPAEEYLEQV